MDVARKALDLAKDVERRVDGHEDICALRYKQLEGSIADVKNVIAWVGGTVVLAMIGALAFFLKANFDMTSELQRQLTSMQQQQSVYEQRK